MSWKREEREKEIKSRIEGEGKRNTRREMEKTEGRRGNEIGQLGKEEEGREKGG